MGRRGAETVFRAVADRTRRAILDLLRASPRAAGEIVRRFKVSQPTISQHLGVLADAGLVRRRRSGRRILYRLSPRRLRAVHDWSAHYAAFWTDKLLSLGAHLDRRRHS